jgi:hypothetical protein
MKDILISCNFIVRYYFVVLKILAFWKSCGQVLAIRGGGDIPIFAEYLHMGELAPWIVMSAGFSILRVRLARDVFS